MNTYRRYLIIDTTNKIYDHAWYNERVSITKVKILNLIHPTSTAHWFRGYKNSSDIENIENLDTSYVTNMSNMFSSCLKLEIIDVRSFNTENVTDMTSMFSGVFVK